MFFKTLALLLFGALVLAPFAGIANAQQKDQHAGHHAAAATQTTALTEGEVRKVDKQARKITIKHGPIVNLDMPAMTMVFQVADPSMLDQVKVGDRIKFAAEKPGGAYSVTKIEPIR